MSSRMPLTLFATCPKGAESALAAELRALGAGAVRERAAGVSFAGTLEVAYRVLVWSRVAGRLLLEVAAPAVDGVDALYEAVRALPWEDHLRADGTLAVDFHGSLPGVRNTMFGAVRVKDAIADRFRERAGVRPSVDVRAPDVRVNVTAKPGRATIALDLAGEALHRRGYREEGIQAEAPLKENLAAACVLLAGWERIAREGGAFCDPMCGSGTLCVEAALVAGDVAPGLLRGSLGCERWLGHDAALAAALLAEGAARREAGAARIPAVVGSDADPRAVSIAGG
ncbi:MAG: 23S rRNA (guanine(2445)-N(2))/(guanine(2069)-N(7))-methyltransferase, partial [Actinobacteria bacterium]